MRTLHLHPTSSIDSVGQVVPLVIAGATVARALWLLRKLIRGDSSKTRGFVWPFRQQIACPSDIRRDLYPPEPRPSTTDLLLGAILKDHEDLKTMLSQRIEPTEIKYAEAIPDWTHNNYDPARRVTTK